jgi:hypothetical protein
VPRGLVRGWGSSLTDRPGVAASHTPPGHPKVSRGPAPGPRAATREGGQRCPSVDASGAPARGTRPTTASAPTPEEGPLCPPPLASSRRDPAEGPPSSPPFAGSGWDPGRGRPSSWVAGTPEAQNPIGFWASGVPATQEDGRPRPGSHPEPAKGGEDGGPSAGSRRELASGGGQRGPSSGVGALAVVGLVPLAGAPLASTLGHRCPPSLVAARGPGAGPLDTLG